MELTLLYFEGCPNWLIADEHLRILAAEDDSVAITRHIVDTPEEADRTGFRGSPSILRDGRDLFAKPDDPVGLSCRIYETANGPAGSPTLGQLRQALAERRR